MDGSAAPSEAFRLLGLEIVNAVAGTVRLRAPPQACFRNINGTMHGGFLSTLLDEAAGMAVLSTLRGAEAYTTLTLHVSFLRAVGADDQAIEIEAHVLRRGRRVATSEARLTSGGKVVCASAVATCLIGPQTAVQLGAE